MTGPDASAPSPSQHRRRPRYAGKYPRRFEEKYKELNPQKYPETYAKVLSAGKTPAGAHRPIMVAEVLQAIDPKPGEIAIDCTLGYGGHALEILARINPGGLLIGLDADPIELPKTEARLRQLGYNAAQFLAVRSNFAGLPQVLAQNGIAGADMILADLGVSSMQLDDPARGFSLKTDGPLDMRMNPERGQPASAFLKSASSERLGHVLSENADEPHAPTLAAALAGRDFPTAKSLVEAIHSALPNLNKTDRELSARRVFQALRIAVNDEFSALDTLLRHLPSCLNSGGRVAIITFHSGEDRRVKKSFEAGFREKLYQAIAEEPIRPSPAERGANPRSSSAKLRWAVRNQ